MKKFREVDLDSYLKKYDLLDLYTDKPVRDTTLFINKYKKFNLDREKYNYDEFLRDKVDSIVLLLEQGQWVMDKDITIDCYDWKVNDYIFDLKRIFFKTNILTDESIYYDDRIKLKEIVMLLCKKYQENIKYHIKKIENIFDELEIGLKYNKELEEYLEKVGD
jgi:hypothetical protein